MMLSRTRVVNTLIVLLTMAVVCLAILPWLIPRIQEAARDKPDPGRVLTAIREHQATLDAEWTDTGPPPGLLRPRGPRRPSAICVSGWLKTAFR